MKKNKWINGAIPAVAIHLSIGSVYAWSVFTTPVMEALNVSMDAVQWTFSIAIFFLGMSAAFLGGFVGKFGPKVSAKISGTCFAIGLMGSGLAVATESIWLLYIFYGAIGGIGLGTGYITPIKCLVQWFKEQKGLATGLAVMGFGFASMIAGPLIQYLIDAIGLMSTFIVLGAGYGAIIIAASFLIAMPEVDEEAQNLTTQRQYTPKEAVRKPAFYGLWVMLFINITVGISLISVASNLVQESIGLTATVAAGVVGFMGIFNGAGRFCWATASDYLGRPLVFFIFFILQIAAFLILPNTQSVFVFQVFLFLIMTCYGGGFACIPAYISDIFGTEYISAIHGRILTAWAMAGLVGPYITSKVYLATGSYAQVLYVLVCFIVVAFVVSFLLKRKFKNSFDI